MALEIGCGLFSLCRSNLLVKVLLYLAAALIGVPAYGYSGGSGTAGDPYLIATKADLLALRTNPAHFS